MKIAKITIWDGRVFYTDDFSQENLHRFFTNARADIGEPLPQTARAQVDLIEMTPEEYRAIPATADSARMFGQSEAAASTTTRHER